MEAKKLAFYLIGFMALLAVIFLPGFSELQRLREENAGYQRRIEVLEVTNDKLKEELVKLEEDPDYVEKRAREKLGIVRKGEIIYRKKEANNAPF